MNDAEYQAQVERLKELADRWIHNIGLGWWRITNSYDRTGEDFHDSVSVMGGFRTGTVARCFPEWRYGIATIVWNMPEVETQDDEQLELVFVHELMHIFLHELRGDEDGDHLDHEERVASTLAKGFIWARNAAVAGRLGSSTDEQTSLDAAGNEPEPVCSRCAQEKAATAACGYAAHSPSCACDLHHNFEPVVVLTTAHA